MARDAHHPADVLGIEPGLHSDLGRTRSQVADHAKEERNEDQHIGRRPESQQQAPGGDERGTVVRVDHPQEAEEGSNREETLIRTLTELAGEHIAQPGPGYREMYQEKVGACGDQIRHREALVHARPCRRIVLHLAKCLTVPRTSTACSMPWPIRRAAPCWSGWVAGPPR